MAEQYKQAIRVTYQQIRKKLPLKYRDAASSKVCAQIRQLERYRYAKRIALYQATNGEINLDTIWQSAPQQGKYCYFPVLNDDRSLSFLPATPSSSFSKNRYGIAEPNSTHDKALLPDQLDVIFIPLIAFDALGTRLGMGAGYYDRTLTDCHTPLLVGVAYEFQRQSFIEAQPWDVPLDAVITERTTYWFTPDKKRS